MDGRLSSGGVTICVVVREVEAVGGAAGAAAVEGPAAGSTQQRTAAHTAQRSASGQGQRQAMQADGQARVPTLRRRC